jgi:hypothetical protein
MLSGDDEHVRRRLRIEVAEGHRAIILRYDLRGDLAVDDLAEQAVTHGSGR